MQWDLKDILAAGGGIFAVLATILANAMGWLRFGKKDKAEIGKLKSETVLDLAKVLEKKIADENATMNMILQMNLNFASQSEKLRVENDLLHDTIHNLKQNFDTEIQNMGSKYNKKIRDLEKRCQKTIGALLKQNETLRTEIQRLQKIINN